MPPASRPRSSLALLAAACAVALPVGSARADVTCDYDSATKTMTVVNTTEDYVSVTVQHDDSIAVSQSPCEGATRTNTDTIVVRDESDQRITLAIAAGEAFGPGFSDEPGDSDEIEFELDLAKNDLIQYILGGAGSVRIGSHNETQATRLNLNADEDDGVDTDVFVDEHVKKVYISANAGGPSRLDASGGAGTFDHYAGGTVFIGSIENDLLVGGLRHNFLDGHQGNDDIVGHDRFDVVMGGLGDDDIAAGAGNDRLHGSDGVDEIHGGSGDDGIRGQKGNDTLYGEGGVDRMRGGGGIDQCFGGGDGDTIEACEN